MARRIGLASMKRSQGGAMLFVGLVMLLLLTLHAIAALHTGTAQLRIVGNVEDRRAAENAADAALGLSLADSNFAAHPASATRAIDVNDDGAPDYAVAITPTCVAVRALVASQLDAERDAGCVAGAALGAAQLCVATEWDVQALALPAAGAAQTGARSEVHQGISLRMAAGDAAAGC
jgi:hypothetical protein